MLFPKKVMFVRVVWIHYNVNYVKCSTIPVKSMMLCYIVSVDKKNGILVHDRCINAHLLTILKLQTYMY